MEVVEWPDGWGGAHVLDLVMSLRHLRGQGSGSGRQLMRPAYGAAPHLNPAGATATTSKAHTAGDDRQAPYCCRIIHITEARAPSSHDSPRECVRQQQSNALLLQQLRRVLVPGIARSMHLVVDARAARGSGARATIITTRPDTGSWDRSPRRTTRVARLEAATNQQHQQPGAGASHQPLEAAFREARLADVTDPEGYAGRPGAAPRLGRLPLFGHLLQYVADAAEATGKSGWPTTPFAECGPTHRARGPQLWAEEGTHVTDHHVLQTGFDPHLLREAETGGESDAADPTRGTHKATWAEWWQATKAAVADRCQSLEREAARRSRQSYHAALWRTLTAEDVLARGGPIDLNRWRRDTDTVQREERHRREQRRQHQLLHTRGAPVTRPRWWHAIQRAAAAPEPMVRLCHPDGTWATHPRYMAQVMGEAFAQLVDVATDAEGAGGGPLPDVEEAAYLRAIDREERQRRAAWDLATADAWASRARAAASGPPTIAEVRAAIRKGHPDKAPGPDGLTYLFYQRY
ncbi:UNVERIFIED_CONTAM: hypothetical protein K2H54_002440 [Gekko kuhli]